MANTGIPIRSNGNDIDASWWNTIRAYLEGIDAFLDEVEDTIDNGASPAEDVEGLTLDAALHTSGIYEVEISRSTDSVDAFANGRIALQRVAGAWRVDTGSFIGDADASPGGGGITFSVTEAGGVAQLKYVSSTIAGTGYVGTIKLRRVVFDV